MVIRDPDAAPPDAFAGDDRPTTRQEALVAAPLSEPTDTGTATATSASVDITGRSASRIGTWIAKRYELQELLGRGGMGLVYRAKDHELDEEVAIKLLQPEYTTELSEIERLKREIVTARRITHPNVIRIHEFGMDEGGEAFISMEVLPGGSLDEEMRRGPIALNRAINTAVGICEGLGSAHEQGIVHRDLKPENVLFGADGRPKLLDFGLARAAGSSQHTVWGITGTPRYMSPEQSAGGEATPRSDVYSLGVLLFQLFTGTFPFDGRNIEELARKHAEDAPPRPRSIRKELPAKLEALILRALEKDPARRFRNANEMAKELRALKDAGAGVSNGTAGGQDATLLIRADVVDAPSSEPTAIGPAARPTTEATAIGPSRPPSEPRREPSQTSRAPAAGPRREPSQPGRQPADPRREPSQPGRQPADPRREPSLTGRVPVDARRESSFSARPTSPPLRAGAAADPTRRDGRLRNPVLLYGSLVALAALALVLGVALSSFLPGW